MASLTNKQHIATTYFEARRMQWQDLWKHSPIRTPFAHIAYAEGLRDALGLDFRLEGDVDEAGLLVYVKQRGPFEEVVVPPFTPYTPLLLRTRPTASEATQQDAPFSVLLQSLPAYAYAALHTPPALFDVRPFHWAGWHPTPLYTYHLQLDHQDALLAKWSASQRRLFRKHIGEYEVVESTDAAQTIATLCHASYTRQKRTFPIKPAQLQRLIERMQEAELARMFTATNKTTGEVEGGFALLLDDQTAYYWVVGSIPGPAMTILLGTVLPMLFAEGIQSFDFVGANTPSIAEFKRRFGPTLTPYYRMERYGSSTFRVLHTLRRMM